MGEFSYQWGTEVLEAPFPDTWPVTHLAAVPPVSTRSDRELVEAALDAPIQSPPLEKLARPGQNIVIIVGDKSRAWQRPRLFLPAITERLARAGVADRDITLLVATGIHPHHTSEEHRRLLGGAIMDRFRVVDHDCRNDANLTMVGETAAGGPVWINRRAAEADLLIATGAVTFHTLAGFSGGPKSIVPGIAGYATIQANHRLAFDSAGGIRAQIRHGCIEGNPLAENIIAATKQVPIDFLLNLVVGEGGRYLAAVAGESRAAHAQACAQAQAFMAVTVPRRFPLVVANVGGHPRDTELYQSIKALAQAAAIAEAGGTIIFASCCAGGTGPEEWLDWFQLGGREKVVARLLDEFTIPGFVALRVHDLAARYRLILVSSLNPDTVRAYQMEPAGDMAEALALAANHREPEAVAWLPSATTTVPFVG